MKTTIEPVTKALPITRIVPRRGWIALRLGDIWAYRELVYFLVWRDIKVRYKQTALGAAWALLQPLLTMLIFSLFFGRLAKMPSNGVPYPLFSYIALVPWTFFSNALSQSSNSLVGNANLISKIYFPRLAMPLSAVLSGLLDFAIALLLGFGMMAYYRTAITWSVLWVAPFLLLGVCISLGAGLWLSALNVEYRDVRYVIPFLTQFWMFASPIAYPSTLLPEHWRTLYAVNPMVGVIEGFRWAILGAKPGPGPMAAVSTLAALIILVSGAFYFRRMEKSFADIV
jgi:lipopolysaccharide transport system permease protein